MAAADPIAEFRELLAKARQREAGDATACALATADADGRPAARMVLLKQVDEEGFVFYTNYSSRKARELEANPRAALCFYWSSLDRQVRVEGPVKRLPAAESDAYFSSRPRGSRIAAWASKQTEPLASRAELVARVARTEARFLGREVPRPEFWGGYRLVPERIEIWHNQLHRLHDRFVYRRGRDGWERHRLYP
jgi:pyridoxamine 5'-phosphate oxidase